jgi:hypothetical protein
MRVACGCPRGPGLGQRDERATPLAAQRPFTAARPLDSGTLIPSNSQRSHQRSANLSWQRHDTVVGRRFADTFVPKIGHGDPPM